jgi:hypothetical protein
VSEKIKAGSSRSISIITEVSYLKSSLLYWESSCRMWRRYVSTGQISCPFKLASTHSNFAVKFTSVALPLARSYCTVADSTKLGQVLAAQPN